VSAPAGYYDSSYPPSIYAPPAVPATVASVAPSALTNGDPATLITVTGTGFTASSVVRFDAVDTATTFVSATSITASLNPAGAPRTVTVTVAGASGFGAVVISAVAGEPQPAESPPPVYGPEVNE
jgi:hypothetical protein